MAEPELGGAFGPEEPASTDGAAGPPAPSAPNAAGPPAGGPELTWTEVAQVVPVALRAGLMAGRRLLTWTAASSSMLVAPWTTTSPLAGVRDAVVGSLRATLGIDDLEAELRRLTGHPTPAADPEPAGTEPVHPAPSADLPAVESPAAESPAVEPSLRERGRRLLAQSMALEADEEHPAFGLVLEQVAPDEMRLLRVLVRDGAQAAVDVESAGVLAGAGRVVAGRVTLLGEKAGCKHADRLPLYLDNLERLGVVRVGGELVGGTEDAEYQVVEAQPQVAEARAEASRGASRARLVRRSLTLTDFGAAFSEQCLPG